MIPPLSSPFPSEISPHVEEIQAATMAWAAAHRLLDPHHTRQFLRARYGELAARVYPYATRERLQIGADLCTWLFAADDVIFETSCGVSDTARLIPDMWRVLEGGQAREPTPFTGALADLRERIDRHDQGSGALRRWADAMITYALSQVWEAANRELALVPSLDDYRCMRRDTGAMFTVFAIIPLATGLPLTERQWTDPDVRAATEAAVDVVVYDNDLFSYAKERLSPNAPNNLIAVLVAAGRTLRQAIDETVAMREAALARMGEACGRSRDGAPEVVAYLRGLGCWISGSVDYSASSSRYAVTT
ncbi:terpene synthase family protein [Nonomuraea sediminis]|uniref:terpene synthase family protein n=1 Tax=Nonomuraea sediminis TaxID=2835864 RepID=UPI001BDD1E97|nr:hypothetical protein [Nonomuraea sediminis]